jgi:hypothetical protein
LEKESDDVSGGWSCDGPGDGHAEGARQNVVEELVVSGPPERVVHHDRPVGDPLLEDGTVERHVLADAVEREVVSPGGLQANPADLDWLRYGTGIQRVDPLGQGVRERPFLAEEDADLLHRPPPSTQPIVAARLRRLRGSRNVRHRRPERHRPRVG